MRAKSRSTMHGVRDLRSIMERWSSRSRATRLMPKSQGVYHLCRLRLGGVSKTRLNSCTSSGGVRALSTKHVWERPGGQALRCPDLYRRDLATLPTPNKGQSLYQLARLHPPAQGKLYVATLSPPERRWEFFLSEASFFHPGLLGFFN